MEYKGFKGIIPSTDTQSKWLLTRKRTEQEFVTIGDFKFPGFWTIQKYKNDKFLFRLAIFLEVLFLASFFFLLGGVDIIFTVIAIVCVALDLIGAFFHYKNGDNISRAQLKLNNERYLKLINKSDDNKIQQKEHKLRKEKNKTIRKIGVAIIILSILGKILGSVVIFELPVLIVASVIIYCFVAYIHINHSGFWFAGWNYYRAMDKQLIEELEKNDDIKIKNDPTADYHRTEVENIPPNVTLKEIKYIIFPETNVTDSLDYVETEKKWYYNKWRYHFWDDIDLENFINSKDDKNTVLSDAAKAFIAADITNRRFLN